MAQLKRLDPNKAQWHLLPWRELEHVVRVFMAGNAKRGGKVAEDNWQECVKADRQLYADALMRHFVSRESGQLLDGEDGCYLMAKVAVNALILLWLDLEGGAT
jgi:hypothetical protein